MTLLPLVFVTHMAPRPSARLSGSAPTWMGSPSTCRDRAFTRVTVFRSRFATHTKPPPVATPSAPGCSGMGSSAVGLRAFGSLGSGAGSATRARAIRPSRGKNDNDGNEGKDTGRRNDQPPAHPPPVGPPFNARR